MEGAQLKRSVHVATTLFDGIVVSLVVANDDFQTPCFHGLHPTGGDLIHPHGFNELLIQEALPRMESGEAHPDR